MAKRIYRVSPTSQAIQLNVQVGTGGVADSIVYQTIDDSQFNDLAAPDVNGSIKNFIVGDSNQLQNTNIYVQTFVSFDGFDQTDWPIQLQILSISYRLEGGPNGALILQRFDPDDVKIHAKGRVVIVRKKFELI